VGDRGDSVVKETAPNYRGGKVSPYMNTELYVW